MPPEVVGTKPIRPGSQLATLVEILDDGAWYSTAEILAESQQRRGEGMTVHSRIAELRGRGFVIETDRVPGERGSRKYRYRLAAVPEAFASTQRPAEGESRESGQASDRLGQSDRAGGPGVREARRSFEAGPPAAPTSSTSVPDAAADRLVLEDVVADLEQLPLDGLGVSGHRDPLAA